MAELDAPAHAELCAAVAALVATGVAGGEQLLTAVHDVSGGGLGVALIEMALASNVGLETSLDASATSLFGEGPSRFILGTRKVAEVTVAIEDAGGTVILLGVAGGDNVRFGDVSIALDGARRASSALLEEATV